MIEESPAKTAEKKVIIPHSLEGGIKLVLNGGKSVMESATIPIRWFFTDELTAKRPVYLLIIEQNETEMKGHRADFSGARRLVKVTDCVDFIQFLSPGTHRIIVVALNDTKGPSYLHKRQARVYEQYVALTDLMLGIQSGDYTEHLPDVIGFTIQEIEVPQEFFARKPGGRFKEAVWNWGNRMFENPPRDECQYRARLIWAFTGQAILYVLWYILRFAIQITITILFPLLRILAFIAGFRPVPLFEGIGRTWTWSYDIKRENLIMRFGDDLGSYRVWEGSQYHTEKSFPITGSEILLAIGGCYGIMWMYKHQPWTTIAILSIFGFAAGLAIYLKWKVRKEQKQTAPRSRDLVLEEEYQAWLRANMAIARAPASVDLKNLPPAYRGGFVQKFRIAFWDTKIKVCRPFAK